MQYLALVFVVLEFHAVVIISLRQHFNYDRQPYGPRMCQDLCRRIVGCSQYVFSVSHLVCRVKNVIAAERRPDITKKSSGPNKDCAWNTLIFYTRSGRPQCARVSEGARLLTVESVNEGNRKVRELDTGDGAIENYPFINDDYIQAMAYVPSQRRILVATSRPFRIKSYVLDNYVSSTINKKWSAFALCVDDSKQLVFFTAFNFHRSNCRISRMTTTGKDFRIIYNNSRRATGITLDPSEQLIYFSQFNKICRTNYDGLNVSTVYHANGIMDIEDVLFCNSNAKYVFQNVYFRNFLHKISHFRLLPYNIVIYENTAYVSRPSGSEPLSYFSLRHRRSKTTQYRLTYKATSNVILCLIK